MPILLAVFALTCQMIMILSTGETVDDLYVEPKFCEDTKKLIDARYGPAKIIIPDYHYEGSVTMVICHNPGDRE